MLYFAYGSNLHVPSLADWARAAGKRTPVLRDGRGAVLDNYRLCFPIFSEYWGGGTVDVVRDPGKYVAGAVFEVSDADVQLLDEKVGRRLDAHGREAGTYRRIPVEIAPLGKGARFAAFTYQGVTHDGVHVPPTQNYMDLLVRGAFKHNLSMMWISYLKSFATQPPRTPGGRPGPADRP